MVSHILDSEWHIKRQANQSWSFALSITVKSKDAKFELIIKHTKNKYLIIVSLFYWLV